MSTVVVVGTQWGDEGKGKITDYLAEKANVVARYQGGNNAGHRIRLGDQKFDLHLLPSGILYENKVCVIGNGMVVDPRALIEEMDYLKTLDVKLGKLVISDRAHVVMPYHIRLDELEEERKGASKIGTTRKGIGPAYMDKAARIGIRVVDLLDRDVFRAMVERNLLEKNRLFERYYEADGFTAEEIMDAYLPLAELIRPFVTDTSVVLEDAILKGQDVLFEGAQATMLDLDHGTYPYVTASNPVAGGVCIGSGVGPTEIDQVIGVVKAYTTRVGEGPFVSELTDALGDHIREVGHEYGVTTGRPRRVGWFDGVVTRHARRVSGLDSIAVTKLDILSGLDELRVCVAYDWKGQRLDAVPASIKQLSECKPIYESLPGWKSDISNVRNFEELPKEAQNYLNRLSELTGAPISLFGTGADRDQIVQMKQVF
ncbi:adenylosuccinate synthase [Ferroacidibacillus organovorans]|uniref:Adenylosuccinate synthetase n=1 Tax=Ferroacidibacillus organovorans TaxID=1765683 RepID=A0A101XS63_9BACL|nr:adenylosuccinate synthase [Ferroacidibacillus organovorans]KUO96554.1 adenylosuccinate synthetase [Ferroacidibacillus organovorans]